MKLGWLLFQYAPPDLKLSPAQKREARRRTWRSYTTTPWSKLLTVLAALFLASVFTAALLLLDRLTFSRYYTGYLIAAPIVLIGITWLTNALVGRWMYERAHRMALRDMGFDVCMQCGYWLRGLPSEARNCPECGAVRALPPDAEAAP